MKRISLLILFFLGYAIIHSQTIIAKHSFENSGDTWNSAVFSSPPCNDYFSLWGYRTSLAGQSASDGSRFWGFRNIDGTCGGTNFETISLPNINISANSNVFFSFDYFALGFDNNEDLKYELFYDNVSQGEVIVVDGIGGNSDNTDGWVTETVNIPSSVTNVRVILYAKNNRYNERGGFDNIRLYESDFNSSCVEAQNLTVGQNNTENIITATNANSYTSGELPTPNCGGYQGNDVWFKATVPASGNLIVETQNSIIDPAIAIYSGTCGSLSLLDCNDDIFYNGSNDNNLESKLQISTTPNSVVFIRVWSYNNQSTGNFNIVAYWNQCPETTTWNGSSWTNGTPNETTSAIINSNYNTNTNGNFESCNCTINNGVIVNIAPNSFISIENDLILNGTLNIQHEGSLVMIEDDGTVTGSGITNVNKTSTPFNKYDYMYWSSPTSNETIGSALTNFTPEYIFRFDNPSSSWANVNGGTIMSPGVGYIAEGDTSGSFPKTVNITFDGTVNTSNITTPLGTGSLGWNLVGNPYPSAIDANLLLNDISNSSIVNATIFLWTHNTEISDETPGTEKYNYSSNDYATYTAGSGGVAAISGGPRPNGFIASGQGFFIQANTAGNLTFKNSMRVTGNNNQLFKSTKTKKIEKDRIWLSLNNEKGAYSEILVGYFDGASDELDRNYDGRRLGGNSYVSFYSLINDDTFAIQGKGAIANEDIVKLGFSSNINIDDKLKISIQDIEGQLNDYNIYLQDNLLNITHDLKASDYEFTMTEKGVFNERFELKFNKVNIVLANENHELSKENLVVAHRDNELIVSTRNGTVINNFKAYDILGKLIINETPSKNKFTIGINNISAGTVLLINTELENNQKITKKILVH